MSFPLADRILRKSAAARTMPLTARTGAVSRFEREADRMERFVRELAGAEPVRIGRVEVGRGRPPLRPQTKANKRIREAVSRAQLMMSYDPRLPRGTLGTVDIDVDPHHPDLTNHVAQRLLTASKAQLRSQRPALQAGRSGRAIQRKGDWNLTSGHSGGTMSTSASRAKGDEEWTRENNTTMQGSASLTARRISKEQSVDGQGRQVTHQVTDAATLGVDVAHADGSKQISGGKLSVSRTEKTTTVVDDRTKLVTQTSREVGGSYSKGVPEVKAKISHIERREEKKISDTSTVYTTHGESSAEARAALEKDDDGKRKLAAEAKASYTAYGQKIKTKHADGTIAEAGYKVGSAEATAGGSAQITKDQVKLTGNVGAKATLVGGNAKIVVPTFRWDMFGEEAEVQIFAGVSAEVLAEVSGNLELDVSKGKKLGVELKGGGKAFAGAKAGVEVGGKIRWLRNKKDYAQLMRKMAESSLGSFEALAIGRLPQSFWQQLTNVLLGTRPATVIAGKAGAEGTLGIGGEASFEFGMAGGKIKVSGALQGTIGLGGSLKTSLELDAIEGVRFLGALGMRGHQWLFGDAQEAKRWLEQASARIARELDNALEKMKKEGGVAGSLAAAADWIGDDLLDWW